MIKTLVGNIILIFLPMLACLGQQQLFDDPAKIEFKEIIIASDDGLHSWENMEIFHEDEDGIIWTAINQGLFRYNGHTVINVSNYLFQAHSIDLSRQPGIQVLTDKNIIWYGTRKGLHKIDKNNLTSTKIFLDQPLYTSDYRNYIKKLQIVGDTLYVGTANGLYLVDTHSNKVLSKYLTNGKDFEHRESSNSVQSIYPDIEPGFFWVVAYSGLYRINKLDGNLEKYFMRDTPYSYPGSLYPHNFFKGHPYKDNLLFPSWGLGIVKFNLGTKEFSYFETKPNLEWDRENNIIRSVISINDSISLTNVARFGNALFNRNTNNYQWLKTPEVMKEGVFMDVDRSGYVWSSKGGHIFRSTRPVVKSSLSFHHIIDVTGFMVNDKLKSRPALDGYSSLDLGEKERNIHFEFTVTKPYVIDTVRYDYRLDSEDWQPIETPNNLKLFALDHGNHRLNIRALDGNGTVLADREMTFNIYLPFYKSKYFIGIGLLALFTFIYLLGRYRNTQKMNSEKMRLGYEMQLSKLESEALRSQINPHFIFNTLNSIKFYAIKKSKEETTDFITKFSVLIRQVLENSKQSLITVEEEIETIRSYIEIEKYRFSSSFDFSVVVDSNVDFKFMIPPMVVQPFIENAIWHGLMHKENDRILCVRCRQRGRVLTFEVEDNGIGRTAAMEISKNKQHKSSLGISITDDRLKQLKILYNLKCTYEIIDLYSADNEAAGTKVIIQFEK